MSAGIRKMELLGREGYTRGRGSFHLDVVLLKNVSFVFLKQRMGGIVR